MVSVGLVAIKSKAKEISMWFEKMNDFSRYFECFLVIILVLFHFY